MSTDTDRLSNVEGQLEQINERLGDLSGRMDAHDGRFDTLETRIDRLDGKIDQNRRDIRQWLVLVVLATSAILTTVFAVLQIAL